MRHALDRGIDYFDTAESYTGGASEETLGRALRGVREKVTLASKVAVRRAATAWRTCSARSRAACAGSRPTASTSTSTTP